MKEGETETESLESKTRYPELRTGPKSNGPNVFSEFMQTFF